MPDEQVRELTDKLLSWYRAQGRELPWRNTRDPYAIWVSEVLLQQTQVSRGLQYYPRFLERFPSLEELARASWRNVLPVWRSLGYYNRGRNMLSAAKIVMKEYAGKLPAHPEELIRLPGIGPYTANAVACFAYGKAVPTLDTNQLRVFQRIFGCPKSGVASRAANLIEHRPRSARKLNYALMDVGSQLCQSRRVSCERCPLSQNCHFHLSGLARKLNRESISKDKPERRTGKEVIDVGVACIHRQGKYLIGKRSKARGGLWEFPGGKREGGESLRDCIKREIKEELGIEVSVRPPFLREESEDGEHLWRLNFCRCQILKGREVRREHAQLKWVTAEDIEKLPFPKANKLAVERLKQFRH